MSPQDARLLDGVSNDLTAELRRRLAGPDPSDPAAIERHVRAAVRDVIELALIPKPTVDVSSAQQLALEFQPA